MEYVLRYDVKPNKSTEFRAWLKDNESVLRDHAPEGWEYRGTFFAVRAFGDYTNETRWGIDDYAALGSGFGDPANVQALQEWMDHVDQTRPFQATLYKGTEEVDILPGS